jgi:catechol 2,3-dioxygenase-like lactoylglutathione lyase family enzyme
MTNIDDIAFLEEFRAKIERFLIAGAAPTQDPLWGGKALTRMKEAMQDEGFLELRREINQTKGHATEVLERLGVGCTFKQHPPPAVGGAVTKFPLFDLITDNQSLHTVDGAAFTDKIDEAIGLLKNKGSELGPASPFFIVSDVSRALEFYENRLGFECHTRTPEDAPFFAIVRCGAAQLILKALGPEIAPLPNPRRHDGAQWDAFIHTPDPDALSAELTERGAPFHKPLTNTDDGLRGFEIADPDGYVLFFGRPV